MVTILLHYYYGNYRYLTITIVTTVTSPFLCLLSSIYYHRYYGYCCYIIVTNLLPFLYHYNGYSLSSIAIMVTAVT